MRLLVESPAVRKAKAEHDIYWFAHYYLRHYFDKPAAAFHKEWITYFTTERRICIACPRGHAKSTWWSLVFTLHSILFNKKRFILILSDTQKQAELNLGQVIEELETNESIIRDFGRIAGYIPPSAEEKRKWTVSDIVTLNNIRVMAFGYGGKLRGLKHRNYRPDLIILDDVENDQSVRSKDQRDKYKDTFKKSILNLGNEDTQVIVIGTILHYDSLLSDLIEHPPAGYITKLYRAIDGDKVLWHERYTLDYFEKLRSDIGSIAFEQEFQNNPMAEGTRIFVPVSWYDEIDLSAAKIYAYVDLAISEKQTADFTAIVPIAKLPDGKLYILQPERIKGTIHDQIQLVLRMHAQYKFAKLGVEDVAYQKAFHQVLIKELQQRNIYDLNAVPVKIDKDKRRRAVEVQHLVENGTVHFNRYHKDLLDELYSFPLGVHDDLVDSMVGGIKLSTTNEFVFIANY